MPRVVESGVFFLFDVFRGRSGDNPLTHVKRLEIPSDRLSVELTLTTRLRAGDHVLCVAGDVVPCDGDVVDGIATVMEPTPIASTQVVRTLGNHSHVTADTLVLSDYLVVTVGTRVPDTSWSAIA